MYILIELRNVKLEPNDLYGKESHLDEVAKTHRLKPNSICKSMRSYLLLVTSLVTKSTFLLKVSLATNLSEFQISECSTALEEATTDVDFRNPGVLNDSVCHFGLHGTVHVILSH